MAHGFEIRAVIKRTLGKIFRSAIPLILCISSKLLYDCLIKLSNTQEMQLMVDVMSLRQSYKQQKISEVKWMFKYYNTGDFMTKAMPPSTLKTLIDANCINISITE